VYGNGTLRAEFRVDTEILPAELLGSLSLSEAYINTEDGYQDITADAVISSADEDGMITLTCTFPNGLPPSSYLNFIMLQLSCDDSEYPVVNWTSSGSATFEIP
jgi:phage-related baseplate assembly protein